MTVTPTTLVSTLVSRDTGEGMVVEESYEHLKDLLFTNAQRTSHIEVTLAQESSKQIGLPEENRTVLIHSDMIAMVVRGDQTEDS